MIRTLESLPFRTVPRKDLEGFLDNWRKAFYMDRGPGGLVQHFQHWALESVSMKNN
jgi:hypothetical protein